MILTLYLGRSILKYEAFENLVFDPELSEHLYIIFYNLLLNINSTIPDREERIRIIDNTECLFVVGKDEIIFNYKHQN